jgi:hypothetical protein
VVVEEAADRVGEPVGHDVAVRVDEHGDPAISRVPRADATRVAGPEPSR